MKIFKSTQSRNSMKLVLGALIATFAFAAAASAQSAFEGKFVLPHEVRWNRAVLPAGEYTIRMNSLASSAIVRSTSGNTAVYTAVPILDQADKGASRLTITNVGNVSRVRSMNLPQIGKTLIFEPLTRTEKEMFAKAGQIDTVPVISARK